MALDLSLIETIAGGLDHPEGVAYGLDGCLYASGEAGQVYRISLAEGKAEQFAASGGFGLGIAIDADNNLYVCDMGVHAVVRISPAGERTVYATGTEAEPAVSPNYPAFDAAGNLYVSDSRNWGKNDGLLYKFRPGGQGEVWCRAASDFTNGLALSADGSFLYVVETHMPGVSRIPIKKDGSAGEREVVVFLPKTAPDGIAFDVEGNLYITCYAPDRIYRLSPGGALEIVFDEPIRMVLNAPTNIAFAGPDLDRLAIASLGGYAVAWADVGARGLPLHHPKL
jgi:gluconolactonase